MRSEGAGGAPMITALVLMNVVRGTVNDTAQALLAIPGVAEVYSVTGAYDLVAVLRLARYEELADVVTGQMVAIAGIVRTETLMAFKAYSREDLEQAWDIGVESSAEQLRGPPGSAQPPPGGAPGPNPGPGLARSLPAGKPGPK